MVLALITVSAFLDRLWSAQKAIAAAAQEGERYFRTFSRRNSADYLDSTSQSSTRDFYNKRWYDYTGKATSRAGVQRNGDVVLHPDDRSISNDKWEMRSRRGKRMKLSIASGVPPTGRMAGIWAGRFRFATIGESGEMVRHLH